MADICSVIQVGAKVAAAVTERYGLYSFNCLVVIYM